MSLTVKSLNSDTTFLLTFSPAPPTACASPGVAQRPFTILIDPWLAGGAIVLSPKFALVQNKGKSCLSSLRDLPAEPDLVLISQSKPDHCHRETLCQLPADTRSTILVAPRAAKKILGWKHFNASVVRPMRHYSAQDKTSVYHRELPATSPKGLPGELTIAFISPRWDMLGMHNAIGITYRAPRDNEIAIDIPTPPDSPVPHEIRAAAKRQLVAAQPHKSTARAPETLSVIYTPHGVPYSLLAPYARSHLEPCSALPLTALIHPFDRIENPWYMGGNIATGFPGGVDLARRLRCRAWIAAHDSDKEKTGWSVQMVRTVKHGAEEVRAAFVDEEERKEGGSSGDNGEVSLVPDVVSLVGGQAYSVGVVEKGAASDWVSAFPIGGCDS